MSEADLSDTEKQVLKLLAYGQLPVRDRTADVLLERTGLRRHQLKRVLYSLEERGLVVSDVDVTLDRRVYAASVANVLDLDL